MARILPNILLCGASSVGKTTLATEWCHRHRTYRHIEEVAREVMKNHSPPITQQCLKQSLATDKALFAELQRLILEEQSRREAELGENPFISDRGPDPLVYARQKLSKDMATSLENSQIARSAISRYRDNQNYLVVVLSPLPVEPKDDGVRLVASNEEQEQFTDKLCCLLNEYRIPFVRITESGRLQRLESLEKAVKGDLTLHDKVFRCNIPFFITSKVANQQNTLLQSIEILSEKQIIIRLSQPFSRGQCNRMVDRYGKQKLLLVSFHQKMAPNEVLLNGLTVRGRKYNFLGCSSSGLKERKCYMLCGSIDDLNEVLGECGDFGSIRSVSKQLKRIGLLFSAAWPSGIEVSDEKASPLVEDIEKGKHNFTDGCGAIGTELANKVLQGALPRISEELEGYLPTVFQIRYQGYKGIVVRDGHPDVKPDCLMIRKSMKKFNPGTIPFRQVWLCEYSRPYTYGHLNKQFIMLFSALGIKDDVFLKKQKDYLKQVSIMKDDPVVAIQMLRLDNQQRLAAKVAQRCTPEALKADKDIQKVLHRLQSKFIEKMSKLSIPVLDSRTVFGVCDPFGVLQYGECFVRITDGGKPRTIQGKVTVGKNPCYLLGDVRLLTAVSDSRTYKLEHLVDCIVFPVQGERPHPAEIAGSDLDGDQYFVTWDKDLLVPQLCEPYEYPSIENEPLSKVTRKDMIDYFANYKSNMGQIDSFYKLWAEGKGVDSFECQELGKLFARSVDAAKTGDITKVPPNLNPSQISPQQYKSVWKKMETMAEEKQKEMRQKVVTNLTDCSEVSEDFVWSTVSDKELSMSEYQYFQFVQHWCSGQDYTEEDKLVKLQEICSYINFGEFTVNQQKEAIDAGIPRSVVTNDLNKSQLLEPDMLAHFSLDSPHCGWRFYFQSHSSSLNWQHLLRAFQHHNECLLIIKLPDGVRFALHFLTQIQPGETQLPPGTIESYFFSPHFNFKLRHVLGDHYSILLDPTPNEEILQLYRNSAKSNSFLWLAARKIVREKEVVREIVREKEVAREIVRKKEVYDRISIDINSFKRNSSHPRINKENFLSVEVFVRNYSHEPAFLDILVADQPEFVVSVPAISPDETEDPPSDDEEEDDDGGAQICDVTDLDAAIAFLHEAAVKGQLHHFLAAFRTILSIRPACQKELCESSIDILLKTLVFKYSSKFSVFTDFVELLQLIIVSYNQQGYLNHPYPCLLVLSRLSQLHCTALVEQMVSLLLPCLCLSNVSDYLDILHQWQLWFFLPFGVANSTAIRLYDLSRSLFDTEELKLEKQPDNIRYSCLFSNLLLRNFLSEVCFESGTKLVYPVTDTDITLNKLKVYDYKSPHDHQIKDLESRTEDKMQDNVWKAGFNRPQGIQSNNFTCGSYVAISMMIPNSSKGVKCVCVALGKISNVSRHPANIVVEIQGVPHCLRKSALLCKGHWQLRLVGNVTAFNRAAKALRLFKAKPTELTSLVSSTYLYPTALPKTINQIQPSDTLPFTSGFFNSSQQQAITASLSQRLTLIHGPPGTGKTRVACEIIRCMCQSRSAPVQRSAEKNRVLAVAETNMAVDNLTRCLLQLNLRVVRIGNVEQVSADIRHVTLEQQIERDRIEDMKPKRKSPYHSKRDAKCILNFAEVVTATCTGAGDSVLEGMKFPFVVVDEATQAIEPITLIPIMHHCQQLTLIGDPLQLPPTLPNLGKFATDDDVNQLSVTLFHRLQQQNFPSTFLEEQHRMHPEIARFSSDAFYNSKLKSGASVHDRAPLELACFQEGKPLLFITTSCNEHRVGSSIKNQKESEIAAEVARYLLNNQVCAQEMAILTPYNGQVRCIYEKVSRISNHIEVCTIDGFQGREKDVIIFSTVRCNADGNLGFTDDSNRMNVLLTRAKRGLIGIGCKKTLSQSQLWRKWLQHVPVYTIEDFRHLTAPKVKQKHQKSGHNQSEQRPRQHHHARQREESQHTAHSSSKPSRFHQHKRT